MREPVTTTDSVATCCANAALTPLNAAMVVAPEATDFRLVALISNNVVPFVLSVARCLAPKGNELLSSLLTRTLGPCDKAVKMNYHGSQTPCPGCGIFVSISLHNDK
jgi:hypothetical protein